VPSLVLVDSLSLLELVLSVIAAPIADTVDSAVSAHAIGVASIVAVAADTWRLVMAGRDRYCISMKVGMVTTLTVILHEIPHEVMLAPPHCLPTCLPILSFSHFAPLPPFVPLLPAPPKPTPARSSNFPHRSLLPHWHDAVSLTCLIHPT